MSASAPALDRRSLTLPDWRTALKRRFKRPRKPSVWMMVLYLIVLDNAYDAYDCFTKGKFIAAAVDLAFVGLAWGPAREMEKRKQTWPGWFLAFWIALIVLQVIYHG